MRENYLLKVAREGTIGERICFQGATAKNRSLVAAFEQKLEKPIAVSRYCHVTGALGVALELREMLERSVLETAFRGLELYTQTIEVRGEVCDLCKNHCKLRMAEVGGETVAYGFLGVLASQSLGRTWSRNASSPPIARALICCARARSIFASRPVSVAARCASACRPPCTF